MRTEDFKTLADIGMAIWADPDFSRRTTLETVAAVSLLDLNPERTIERAATALLERAARDGTAANTRRNLPSMTQPFFLLEPEARFLLVVLHQGRWSYARVARVLEETPEKIEELAWQARLQLLTHSARLRNEKFSYPSGGGSKGAYCPEYQPYRPWTQRFLDEEIASGADRLFLQNHLMACDPCRNALSRAREVYFAVEALIPRTDVARGNLSSDLLKTSQTSRKVKARALSPDFLESLKIFFRRPDVILVLGLSAALGYLFFRF